MKKRLIEKYSALSGSSRLWLMFAVIAASAILLWAFAEYFKSAVKKRPRVATENTALRPLRKPDPDYAAGHEARSRRAPRRHERPSPDGDKVGEAVKTRADPEEKHDDPGEADAIPGEFVLSFQSEEERAEFIELAGRENIRVVDSIALGNSLRIRTDRDRALKELLARTGSKIKYASNYYVLTPQPIEAPAYAADPVYHGFGRHALEWLGVSRDNETWGQGVTVAVLDTAIREHPLLQEAAISRRNMSDELPGNGANEWHGTAVASLIAGKGPGYRSIAPSSHLLALEVASPEGIGDAFTLAKGIVAAADSDADIINVCLGTYGNSFILRDAVEYASRKGSIIVAAGGNDAVDTLSFPAGYEKVVSVSGVDASGRKAGFANEGRQLDLAAPAVAVAAAGKEDGISLFSGTSAGAPLVSGLLAYLIGQEGLSPASAIEVVKRHSNDAGPPGPDSLYGEGIIDAERILRRGTEGIYDAALADIYVGPSSGGGSPALMVTAENRGTEELQSVVISVTLNERRSEHVYQSIRPGQTVHAAIPVDPDESAQADVTATVTIPGDQDSDPANNRRRTILFRSM